MIKPTINKEKLKSNNAKNRLLIKLIVCNFDLCQNVKEKKIPEFCVILGSHIRKLRVERNISIEEIAYKADIDAQNLRKYELGQQEMKISMLKRIADAFGITTSELLSFDD